MTAPGPPAGPDALRAGGQFLGRLIGRPQAGLGADGGITAVTVGLRSWWMARAMVSTAVIP